MTIDTQNQCKVYLKAFSYQDIDDMMQCLVINDLDVFCDRMKKDKKIGIKYKKMKIDQFRYWCEQNVTKYAFNKLKEINKEINDGHFKHEEAQ